jgi:hypothetical protein
MDVKGYTDSHYQKTIFSQYRLETALTSPNLDRVMAGPAVTDPILGR